MHRRRVCLDVGRYGHAVDVIPILQYELPSDKVLDLFIEPGEIREDFSSETRLDAAELGVSDETRLNRLGLPSSFSRSH